MDRRYTKYTFFKYIACLSLLLTLVAGSLHASEKQSFRIRLHQAIKQDFTAADVAEEIRFGKRIAAQLLGLEKLYSDAKVARYISLIGNTVALRAPRSELDYYFAVLDSDNINAYSTPGGYIFITRGALELAKDEAEVAAILAHEIAHVTLRHVVTALGISASDQSQLSGFTRFLGSSGNTTQVALKQAVDKAIAIIYRQGYQIADELQADRVATLLLAQSGYDPLALERYLRRAEEFSRQHDPQVTTHPAPEERFARLEQLIKAENLAQLQFPTAKARFDKNVTTRLESP